MRGGGNATTSPNASAKYTFGYFVLPYFLLKPLSDNASCVGAPAVLCGITWVAISGCGSPCIGSTFVFLMSLTLSLSLIHH